MRWRIVSRGNFPGPWRKIAIDVGARSLSFPFSLTDGAAPFGQSGRSLKLNPKTAAFEAGSVSVDQTAIPIHCFWVPYRPRLVNVKSELLGVAWSSGVTTREYREQSPVSVLVRVLRICDVGAKCLHRLAFRTSRRGRDNQGSNPGVGTFFEHYATKVSELLSTWQNWPRRNLPLSPCGCGATVMPLPRLFERQGLPA